MNQNIYDIRSPVNIPFPFYYWLILIVLIGVVILLIKKLYRIRQNSDISKNDSSMEKSTINPTEEALQALLILEENIPHDPAEARQFCFKVSSILRNYLECTFEINIMELTTPEIITILQEKEIARLELVEKILEETDVVKFAKYIPSNDDLINYIHLVKTVMAS